MKLLRGMLTTRAGVLCGRSYRTSCFVDWLSMDSLLSVSLFAKLGLGGSKNDFELVLNSMSLKLVERLVRLGGEMLSPGMVFVLWTCLLAFSVAKFTLANNAICVEPRKPFHLLYVAG
jgi:hypothetical protein